MKISEAATESGLSADTIRYYEREGLLQPITRSAQGDRHFSPQDLRWLKLFERLRSTGMSMAEMKNYAELSFQGDGTFSDRRQILEQHRARLDARQAEIDACRELLEYKITTYLELERQALEVEGAA